MERIRPTENLFAIPGRRDRNEGLKRTFTYALLKLMHLSLAKKFAGRKREREETNGK